jgi:hypothetical protein
MGFRSSTPGRGSAPPHPATPPPQIRLWERQAQRVVSQEGVLYDNFEFPELYRLSLQYANTVGGPRLRPNAAAVVLAARRCRGRGGGPPPPALPSGRPQLLHRRRPPPAKLAAAASQRA